MRAWLVDTVGWKQASSPNASGGRTYADSVSVPCRIVDKLRVYKTKEGDEVVSEQTIYFDASEGALLSTNDKLVVEGRERIIYGIERIKDNYGNVYGFEVML